MASYAELREAADAAWATVDRPQRPYVAVSIATCGNAWGAEQTLERIRAVVQERGLDCDVGTVGCPGLCFVEPIVTVTWPDGVRVLYG
ncbi:MAG TPA: (2Fe-2S) ferredoxin domain-containing protein, partial [Dehalococcoidia bacterium]